MLRSSSSCRSVPALYLKSKRDAPPVARNRKVTMTQLNPVVHLEFHQINDRAKPLSPEAVEFTAFLKSYILRWAGRSGVL